MRKLLLFAFTLLAINTQAQIFRLTYNTTTCPSPLNGASAIYLYAGANITAPGNPPTHFADAAFSNPGLYSLTQTSPGFWEICFNPYQIFRDGNGSTIPTNATIYSFDISFRNGSTTIYTAQCNGNSILINNPMTSPVSSNPTIAYGSVVPTCNVGLADISGSVPAISNFPNPLKASTLFSLNISGKSVVSLEIFNVLGKKVATLVDQKSVSGRMDISWKGVNENGAQLPNGCYFYTLRINDKAVNTNKLIISR